MLDWLNKLRQKPEPVRRLIAFWTSALIVVAMASVWLSGLPDRFGPAAASVVAAAKSDRINEVASPLAGVKAELEGLADGVKGSFKYESQE